LGMLDRLRWRLRKRVLVATAAGVALSVLLGWFGIGTAAAAQSARTEVENLVEEISFNTGASLLEPGTYVLLLEQIEITKEALTELDSRLDLFRPLEVLPFVGSRLKDTHNTVELGNEVARAVQRVLRPYGEVLSDEGKGSSEVFREDADQLADALEALDRAEALAESGTVLTVRQQGLVEVTIGLIRNLAIVALEAPQAVDEAFELLRTVNDVRERFADPIQTISETGEVERLLATMEGIVGRVEERLTVLPGSTLEQLAISLGALEVLRSAVGAASDLLDVSDAMNFGPLSPEFGAVAGAKLASARSKLEQARAQLADVGGQLITEPNEAESGNLELRAGHLLSPAERVLVDAISAVDIASDALGYDGSRTYLILMQNQNEIRATGGFIGATAELTLTDGVLEPLLFEDSTRVDIPPLINNPAAPEPIYWYLWMARLLFRDANWSPSFPDSAQTLMGIYQSSKRVELDGALASTKLLALDLLDVVGTIDVPGIDRPVDRALAKEYVEGNLPFACADRHTASRGKRCFDEDLVSGIIKKLQGKVDAARRARLAETILKHLKSKSILVFAENPDFQEMLVDNGWAGAIESPAQDFLMVVDSSLPGHTKALVSREIDYRVTLATNGRSDAELRVRFVNRRDVVVSDCRQAAAAGGEENVDCYWNFVRVLLPPVAHLGTTPVAALHSGTEKLIWGYRDLNTAQVLTHAEAGLENIQEVGAFIVVEPSTVVTLPINYQLDSSIVRQLARGRHEYKLKLSKQPGVDDDQFDVRVQLPVNARVLAVAPTSVTVSDGVARWFGRLESDVEISVVFETD
jgi:hypothetical protein